MRYLFLVNAAISGSILGVLIFFAAKAVHRMASSRRVITPEILRSFAPVAKVSKAASGLSKTGSCQVEVTAAGC